MLRDAIRDASETIGSAWEAIGDASDMLRDVLGVLWRQCVIWKMFGTSNELVVCQRQIHYLHLCILDLFGPSQNIDLDPSCC